MTIDTTQWHLMLKCKIFHYSNCLSNPQPVLDLITAVNEIFHYIHFDGKLTANLLNRRQPRDLKPTKRNWFKVLSEIREGKISTLLYGSSDPNGHWRMGVYFHLFNEQKRQCEPNLWLNYDSMGFWVEHILFQENTVNIEMCQQLMEVTWKQLHGVYGFADMFISHHTGLVSPKHKFEVATEMKAKVSGNHDSLKVDPRTNVSDAYWLNFLNETHVEKLSGIERIKANLPHAQIESLPYEGASIQISPSPIYDSIEMWQSDHLAVEKILTPIMPDKV